MARETQVAWVRERMRVTSVWQSSCRPFKRVPAERSFKGKTSENVFCNEERIPSGH
jgi:hypothetical protein